MATTPSKENRSVYQFKNYFDFVTYQVSLMKGRGLKSQLALHMKCRLSYVSQILKGKAHLSLEQALDFTSFFRMIENDRDYFLTLVQKDRAGTKELKRHLEQKIEVLQKNHLNLSKRLNAAKMDDAVQHATYYSYWTYAAAHIAATFKGGVTEIQLCKMLEISPETARSVVEDLLRMRLIKCNAGKLEATQLGVHLPQESKYIAQHHTNWRIQALRAIQKNHRENLFYSSVISISKKDFDEIKNILIEAIAEAKSKVKESEPADTLAYFNLDFYC